MRGLLAAFVLALVLCSGIARAPAFPDVYLYVNDFATPGVLLSGEENSIADLCFQVDDLTTAEIAILTVNTTQPWGIDTFAVETFSQNGIGKEGKDNGVLLVVSVDERAWRFEVGYGLEGVLNDAKVGEIGRMYLDPAFVNGDFYGGIYDATYAIGTEIVHSYDPGSNPGPGPQPWVVDWRAIGIAIAIAVALGVLTKGRIFLILPRLLTRGRFGGGRSGGGGARGGY